MRTIFYAHTKPYNPIAALNRRAAACGSPRYAMLSENADYNGHYMCVSWNAYRGYYIAQYTWAGRRVLARGSFADCLSAALREYNRGAVGSSVHVEPREDDAEAATLCRETADLTDQPDDEAWRTWQHTDAAQSVRDYANPGMLCIRFDWDLMQTCDSHDEYVKALAEKYGRAYA